MIINETHDGLTLADDDVCVEKVLDDVDMAVLTVWFTITSQRDDTIRFRLSDPLPEGWSADRVGFHPNHDPEHWEFDDGAMVFERELAPQEEYTTIYALRTEGSSDLEQFKSIPRFVVWPPDLDQPEAMPDAVEESPESPPDAPATRTSGGTLMSAIHPDDPEWVKEMKRNAGAVEELPESDDAPPEQLDESNHSLEMDEGPVTDVVGNGSVLAYEESSESAIAEADEVAEPEQAVKDDLTVDQLLDALESGATAEDRRAVREALGIDGYKGLSARVDYLHKRHGELAAYTDALREFIDEEGTGVEIVDELREQRDELRAEMAAIDDRLDAIVERQKAHDEAFERTRDLEDRVDDRFDAVTSRLDETVSQLERFETEYAEALKDVTSRIDSVEHEYADRFEAIDERIEELETQHEQRLAEISDELETSLDTVKASLEEHVEQLEAELTDLVDEVSDELTENIDDVESNLAGKVDRLDSEMTDSIGAIEEDLDAMTKELAEMEGDIEGVIDWRDRVIRMFSLD